MSLSFSEKLQKENSSSTQYSTSFNYTKKNISPSNFNNDFSFDFKGTSMKT
jgi:hypothetical protein